MLRPGAQLAKDGRVLCGLKRCRGRFGHVIMDGYVEVQLFVLDVGFHKNQQSGVWEKSNRAKQPNRAKGFKSAELAGADRRGRVATLGGPRKGVVRYSPPERPALLRCPRCDWVSPYHGEGEAPEAIASSAALAARMQLAELQQEDQAVFSIEAREWWNMSAAERDSKWMDYVARQKLLGTLVDRSQPLR